MNNKKTTKPFVFFVITVVYTLLITFVDRKPVGAEGTSVGFSCFNTVIRDAIGLNVMWDKITDVFMLVAVLVALYFAVMGLLSLIREKSLLKVDKDLYVLAGIYVVIAILYVAFSKIPINYRPFLSPGETELETSFPSTHVLVVGTILSTAVINLKKKIENQKLIKIITYVSVFIIVMTVIGRLLSGVHWFTDIVGGVLMFLTLTAAYASVADRVSSKD
ncbi:phosphatase PAP2 family protein [Butyrivibrio sp. X503]|uniref:phosphatase PAP2 family protein n=1 Tax=Butyrivibrio sp. X503 TaxID=2364878 RepID=UPI000EAA2229|nr:phosphatase PAP2 family protein [Butyrivibrio sp. X503]RKM58449.1 phosphatase PAP2 family protein [Butyrivibrio sp. X503]